MSAIAVVGGGYVGLTTAACFARLGHDVVCGEVDREKVARLSKGEVPVLEEGLPALVAEGLAARRLTFVVGATTAVRSAEFVFLCVQTPPDDQGAADLSILENAVREIAPVLRPGSVIINKSTVPVGTAPFVERLLGEAGVPTCARSPSASATTRASGSSSSTRAPGSAGRACRRTSPPCSTRPARRATSSASWPPSPR